MSAVAIIAGFAHASRATDKRTDRQAGRQADRQTDGFAIAMNEHCISLFR
jgi:hypothetical protein